MHTGRKGRKKAIRQDRRCHKRRNRIEIMFGWPNDWRRVAPRYDRHPSVLLPAIARAETVLFWL